MSGAVASFAGFTGQVTAVVRDPNYHISPPFARGPPPKRATVDASFAGVQAPFGTDNDEPANARRRKKQQKPWCAPYGRDCDGAHVDEADHSIKQKLHEDAPTACWWTDEEAREGTAPRKTWGALKTSREGGNTRPWKTDAEMASDRARAEQELANAAGVYAMSRTTKPSAADAGAIVESAPAMPADLHTTCFQRPNSAVGAPRQQADKEAVLIKSQHQGRIAAFLF